VRRSLLRSALKPGSRILHVELKSLKVYLNSYRNDGIYFESVTNKILDDLVKVCKPRYMVVTAEFNVRGGILSTVEAEYVDDNFIDEEKF